jgi:hypothetical protein
VDDDLQVVEHDPLARGETVHRPGTNAVILLHPVFDCACDRLQMRFRGPRADNEEIGEARNSLQIQNDDILRLFIRGEIGAGFG